MHGCVSRTLVQIAIVAQAIRRSVLLFVVAVKFIIGCAPLGRALQGYLAVEA
jgi:hypothetical protein